MHQSCNTPVIYLGLHSLQWLSPKPSLSVLRNVVTIFLISKGIDTNAMSPYPLLTAFEKVNKAESLWLLIHCDKMAQVDVIPIHKWIHHWFEPKIIFMPSCFPAVYRVCCRIISELTFFFEYGNRSLYPWMSLLSACWAPCYAFMPCFIAYA